MKQSKGFTLIEMLVVLAIIVIVTGIALSGQSGFNRTLALNNAAYDIALTIRGAQSSGFSSQAFGSVNNSPYGVDFEKNVTASYYLFADVFPNAVTNCGANPPPNCHPGNGEYDPSHSELAQTYNINNGFSITRICAGSVCSDSSPALTQLDISFTRPNADTIIKGKTASWASYTSACVVLSSPQGETRNVSVTQNGQISLVATCP